MTPQEKLLETFREQAMGQSAQGSSQIVAEDPFLKAVKDTITAQAGLISSTQDEPLSVLRKAQETIKTGAEAGAESVRSVYDREIGYKREEGARTVQASLEGQRGFATNTALLKSIVEAGEKSIKDLEQRKQELIMSGNAAAASKLAELQVKEAEMMVTNRQQVFNNLISMAGIGFQSEELAINKKSFQQRLFEFDRTMQMKLGETALKYGIDLRPGDTVESVINKAMPKANELQKLELEDMRATISLKNAQAALSRVSAQKEAASKEDTELLGRLLYELEGTELASALTENVMKSGAPGAVLKKYLEMRAPQNQPDSVIMRRGWSMRSSGLDFANAKAAIEGDVSIQNKSRAIDILRNIYGKPEVDSFTTILLREVTSKDIGTFILGGTSSATR